MDGDIGEQRLVKYCTVHGSSGSHISHVYSPTRLPLTRVYILEWKVHPVPPSSPRISSPSLSEDSKLLQSVHKNLGKCSPKRAPTFPFGVARVRTPFGPDFCFISDTNARRLLDLNCRVSIGESSAPLKARRNEISRPKIWHARDIAGTL